MTTRVGYAMFATGILTLAVVRAYGERHQVLPAVATLPETAGARHAQEAQ